MTEKTSAAAVLWSTAWWLPWSWRSRRRRTVCGGALWVRAFERRVSAWSPVASAGGRRSSDDGGSENRFVPTVATQISQGDASEGAENRGK
jgi:hypothetical protein